MSAHDTNEREFDRLMTAWFDADAQIPEPDELLVSVLDRTKRARRIPGLLLPERWIPMQLSARLLPVPRLVPILALLAVVALAAALAIAIVGSQRKLPPPFGLAANGAFTYLANGHIFEANADGSSAHQITFDAQRDSGAVFSRDGTRLLVMRVTGEPATERDPTFNQLIVMSVDGSHPVVVDAAAANASEPRWSPDDKAIVYTKTVADGTNHIVVAASDGSGVDELGAVVPDPWSPIWSPDGKHIAVGVNDHDLYVLAPDGSGGRRVNTRAYTEIGPFDWSPDSTRLVFTAGDPNSAKDLYIVGLDGAPERPFVQQGTRIDNPRWSPAGDRIAFVRAGIGQGPQVVVFNVDGGPDRTFPGYYGWYAPVWSPDATKLAIVDDRPGPLNDGSTPVIVILDAVGKAPPVIVPTEQDPFDANWQRLAR